MDAPHLLQAKEGVLGKVAKLLPCKNEVFVHLLVGWLVGFSCKVYFNSIFLLYTPTTSCALRSVLCCLADPGECHPQTTNEPVL